jgi:hypothetical protein
MTCKSYVFSLKHLNFLHLHLYCCCIYIHIYTYTTMCKCFGLCKCKWIYYLPFMTIVSLKSILISCGCIPKFKCFFSMGHFDWSFTKNHDTLILPKHQSIFYQYGTMMVLFQEIFWIQILPHLITWIQILLLLFLWIILNNNFYYQVLLLVAFTRTLILILLIVIHIN